LNIDGVVIQLRIANGRGSDNILLFGIRVTQFDSAKPTHVRHR